MEPKLLYATAQQLNPRRAGTPGRAPRNWRAVVDYWRPLRLFIALPFFALPAAAAAQSAFPAHPTVQLRVGAMYASPLVKDEVATSTVDDSIPGVRSHGITVQQKIAPIATLALRFPVRTGMQLEAGASIAHSAVRGDDGLTTWQAATATVANLTFGMGYLYRHLVALRGGVGFTRLFVPDRGMSTTGNSIKPLLEAGASTGLNVGGRVIDLDARVQTHSFGTATLRDNGGSDGNVLRAILQVGTTLWGGAK